MMRYLLLALGAISLSACAQTTTPGGRATSATANGAAPAMAKPMAGSADERALAAVHKLNAKLVPERIGPAPLPGFREVVVSGEVIYVSDDGRYMFVPGPNGALFDSVAQTNLSEAAMASLRVKLLATIPANERIVFSPPNPKHTVTVFTDIECGYCRKLHSEIAQYNAQGIAIEYLAFPRAGIGSPDFDNMVSVWCSGDRKKALTEAKINNAVTPRTCTNTVTMQYNVGQRAGLTGTPMILAADGSQLGGYVSAVELRERLDKLESAPAAAATAAKTTPSGT